MNDKQAPTEPEPELIEASYALQIHLGFEVKGWSTDYARVEQPLHPFLMNRNGIPHGGIYATLLDTAMGFAGCYTGDRDNPRTCLTLTLNVNYLAQAKGKLLITEAFRTGGGRKIYFAEGLVTDELGTKIASATGAFRYRS
ncbi:PaaI family thioesterase [Thalassovita taeanensis]|uniref:Uncharacterized domain 1-containing protein n=1 Tax=Thalassovita taeanensis TaxID=657014 RepID=A0A1H9B6P8_9RHOB|nr:PaaI family thioesterase [Thalassovita taeanensis]SEP84624.1 uncharacterized domain 1-containing protein [Thalassovita taeanensis]